MANQELEQLRLFTETIERRLFDEKIVFLDVPKKGLMRFEFGKNDKSNKFPYKVKIYIENRNPTNFGFVLLGGIDARSQREVVSSLFVEWPFASRKLFEQALAERK